MSGKLDRYTLNIMIHEALLTDGFQWIYTLRRSDYRPHFKFFALNVHLTTVEFVFAFFAPTGLLERNINPCPALRMAFDATQLHRLQFTIVPFSVAAFLSFVELLVWFIDEYRNKRRPKPFTKYILPNWLVWEEEVWDKRRIIIGIVGIVWWAFSVITLEIFIIRDFHLYMRQFSGSVISNEDTWTYGQLLPFFIALAGFLYAVSTWFIEVMRPVAGMVLMRESNKQNQGLKTPGKQEEDGSVAVSGYTED